jgi:hypothetical protein
MRGAMAALTTADYALLVALTSALIAAGSLFWQIYFAVSLDRARFRLTVEADYTMAPPGSPRLRVVILQAVNVGRRPAELSYLGLVLFPDVPWQKRATRRQRRKLEGRLMGPDYADLLLPNSRLPKPLDVGGSAQVLFQREDVIANAKEVGAKSMYAMATATGRAPDSKRIPVPKG